MRYTLSRGACGLVLVLAQLIWTTASAAESVCFGTTSNGRLKDGVSLPREGENFSTYSSVGWAIGRTYVHSRVRAALIDAFAAVGRELPKRRFVYGETGFEEGGPFKPHRTHQNGLSVDIMVPVLRDGQSVPLPGHAFNRFGYDIEFDAQGRYEDYRIDFETLAALIFHLHAAGKQHGAPIERVIFDPALRERLFATRLGEWLRANVTFMKHQAWVRHDEHIHVDFAVRCSKMR